MRTYIYHARDAGGKSVGGEIQAEDEAGATQILGKRDLTVVALKLTVEREVQQKVTVGGKVKTQDVVVFTRQLATMMDAGLPLVQALSSLEEQTTNKNFKPVLRQVVEQVEQGQSFSQALAQHPKVFNDIYVNLIQAGEAGGLLSEILERLAAEQEASARLKRKVKSALMYPMIVSCVALVISLFLVLKVVPQFADIFKDLGGQLPAPTRILIQISNALQRYLLYVVVLVSAAVYGISRLKKTPWGVQRWDRIRIRLPVAGPLSKKIALTRFARTFSALTTSGVPILQTLRIAGHSTGNTILEFAAMGIIESIEKGDGIAVSMAKFPIFPPMLVRMVAAGEQTGRVDTMMQKLAEFYNEEVETTLSGLASLIEPILIVIIGVIVGSIVICMFLPVFKMSELVQ